MREEYFEEFVVEGFDTRKVKHMPKVGSKHFAYTPKGKQAAKTYAKKVGKKVKNK